MKPTKAQRRQLALENKGLTERFVYVPKEKWLPVTWDTSHRTAVWRSKHFFVQVFREDDSVRLSINCTKMRPDGRWVDGITWDELMEIKREIGYGEWLAVEFYPPDRHIVNVANLRHLWIVQGGKLPKHWSK